MSSELLQIGVGGAFAVLVIREVLGFIRSVVDRKATEIHQLRKDISTDMAVMRADLRTQQADIGQLLLELKLQQDREQRFWNRDWPQLTQTVSNHDRRISHLETGCTEIRSHIGMATGQTPPMGVPIIIKED